MQRGDDTGRDPSAERHGGAAGTGGGAEEPAAGGGAGEPAGGVYDWFRRGEELLRSGNPAAAAQLLERAAEAEPESRSVRESLARAQYDAGLYDDAMASFERIVAANPADDYARFGWGLSALRLGDTAVAVEQLALAVAMRPDDANYRSALAGARSRRAATG